MANELTVLLKDKQRPTLPAHLQQQLAEESNLHQQERVPTLGFEGRVWTIGLNGTKTKLLKKNADGDEVAVPVFRGVILDYNKQRGRIYYEGAYDPNKITAPVCWSDDGVVPHPAVKDKQNPTCAGCPHSEKGSKISDNGKATMACSQHRMVAIVPAKHLDFTPLRLKLSITSLWDGNPGAHEKEGWFAFENFTKALASAQVEHTVELIVKIKFDTDVTWPKLLFSIDDWLPQSDFEKMWELRKKPEVQNLLKGTWTPAGIDGTRIALPAGAAPTKPPPQDDGAAAAIAKAAADSAAAKAAADAKAQEDAEKAAKAAARKAAKEAKEAAEKAAQEAAAAKPADDDDDDGMGNVLLPPSDTTSPAAQAAAGAKTVAPPQASVDVPEEVKNLLTTWDD